MRKASALGSTLCQRCLPQQPSDEWIAAVLGHKDTRQVKVYTKGANRRLMARSALTTLVGSEQPRTSDLQTPEQDLQTTSQALERKGR
jgi:hypothetical protein